MAIALKVMPKSLESSLGSDPSYLDAMCQSVESAEGDSTQPVSGLCFVGNCRFVY